MSLIPPFFSDCVAAIGVPGQEDGISWVGSGFFYGRYLTGESNESQYAVYLVSNRHVFEGQNQAYIRANPAGEDHSPARDFGLVLHEEEKAFWVGHPEEAIDVAVVRVNFNLLRDEGMQVAFFRSDVHALRLSDLKEKGVTEGDYVFILGFPMGLVGDHRSVVIVRNGSIARIRDAIGGSESSYLVDASVFPGNSGGPVVLKPELISIEGTKSSGQAALIGIVRAYVPYRDVAVSAQTGQPRVIFEENSGLVAAHLVDAIDACIDEDPKFLQQQMEITGPTMNDAASAAEVARESNLANSAMAPTKH